MRSSRSGIFQNWATPPRRSCWAARRTLGVDQQAVTDAAGRKRQRLVERNFDLNLVQPPPAVAAEPLQRVEARLVGHARAALDPIAQINVRQPGAGGADDMVEDDVG